MSQADLPNTGAVPAPLPENESARLATLRAYGVIDSLPEDVYDDLVFLASTLCGTPIALISIVDATRQFFKAETGLGMRETPREVAFCAHAIVGNDDIFVVEDATKDPRFAGNPLVTGKPDVRFYAGVPLRSAEGHALGTLCAIDTKPRELSETQLRALRVLGRQVMLQLELRRAVLALEASLATRSAAHAPTADAEATAERARRLLDQCATDSPIRDRLRDVLDRLEKLQPRRNSER